MNAWGYWIVSAKIHFTYHILQWPKLSLRLQFQQHKIARPPFSLSVCLPVCLSVCLHVTKFYARWTDEQYFVMPRNPTSYPTSSPTYSPSYGPSSSSLVSSVSIHYTNSQFLFHQNINKVSAIFFSTIIGIILITYTYFLVGHATYADELKKRIEDSRETDYETIEDSEVQSSLLLNLKIRS